MLPLVELSLPAYSSTLTIGFLAVWSQDAVETDKAKGILPQFSKWLRQHGVDDGRVRLVVRLHAIWETYRSILRVF